MTPEDLIDELCHKVVLAPDEPELEAALGELQSALQEHCDYLESVSADYLLSFPLAISKRLSKLHETIAAQFFLGALVCEGDNSDWDSSDD